MLRASDLTGVVSTARPRLLFTQANIDHYRSLAVESLTAAQTRLARNCRASTGLPTLSAARPKVRDLEELGEKEDLRRSLQGMEDCARLYVLTGQVEFGLEARARLLHFMSWDPQGHTSLQRSHEPATSISIHGARTFDWIHDLLTDGERGHVVDVLARRARAMHRYLRALPFESNPFNSHAGKMLGFLGEIGLTIMHEIEEAPGWVAYVNQMFLSVFPAWGGADGGWSEGPMYWAAYMRHALLYAIAIRNAAGIDLLVTRFFNNTPYYALYVATPYFEHRPFGDGQHRGNRGIYAVMYAFSTLLNDPYARWYADAGRFEAGFDLLSFLTFDPTQQQSHPNELRPARLFRDVGVVSTHARLGDAKDDVAVIFRSSPMGNVSHSHANQNAFAIEAYGDALFSSTGYYPWYGSGHHVQWATQTMSSNAVLIDGRGQRHGDMRARGTIHAFADSAMYTYVEGEAAAAYSEAVHRVTRKLLFVKPGVVIVVDEIETESPAKTQWLLHSFGLMKQASSDALTIDASKSRARLRFLEPEALRLTISSGYPVNPEQYAFREAWHLRAETEANTKTRIVTLIEIFRQGVDFPDRTVEPLQCEDGAAFRIVEPTGDVKEIWFGSEGVSASDSHCVGVSVDASVVVRRRTGEGAAGIDFLY